MRTIEVADLLGVQDAWLYSLLRTRRLPLPAKDAAGDFDWSKEDIENARQAFAKRRRPRESAAV
jgi:predicted DNA-binding transcriptional regulator AlpA